MYDDGVSEGVCTLQNALSYCTMCSLRMVQVQMSVSHHHTSYVTSSYMLYAPHAQAIQVLSPCLSPAHFLSLVGQHEKKHIRSEAR